LEEKKKSQEKGSQHEFYKHHKRFQQTLTTEAPVANFFPSFLEASLSLTPECNKKNVKHQCTPM